MLFERDGAVVKADVITVAAPNRRAYMEYAKNATEEENEETLKERIHFIGGIVRAHMGSESAIGTVVLGAFGCGVFGQNPEVVAELFKEEFESTPIRTVYAVIDKGGHCKDGNLTVFKRLCC